jgi:hypothetical protein
MDFNTRTLEQSVLPFNKGYVAPVQFDKMEYGLVFIDAKGNTKWQVRTKGFVVGLARLNDDVISFYSPEWSNGRPGKVIKNLYAGIYNSKNGKLIVEKVIFENKTEWNVDPKVMVTSDLQFAQVLIRYSQHVNSLLFIAREAEKLLTTEKISVISISGTNEFKIADIPSQSVKNRFISCSAISQGEFAIVSESDQVVTTERFNLNDPSHPKKSTFTVNTSGKFHPNGLIKYSQATPDVLYEALCFYDGDYKKQITVAKLDLKTEKITVTNISMNRELAESFPTNSKKNDKQFRNTINSMNLVDLVVQNDKVLLFTQVHALLPGPSRNRPTYGNNEIMISSFDGNLRKTHSMVISREFEIFLESGEKFGYKIDGKKMHLIYNFNSGIARIGGQYAVVDLDNFTLINKTNLGREGLRGDASLEPQAIIWLEKSALVPYNNMAGVKNGQTVFQQVSLNK